MKRAAESVPKLPNSVTKLWHPAPESEPSHGGHGSNPFRCRAYGCPLPGAISNGGESRYCTFHYEAGALQSERVTQWLRENPLAVEALTIPDGISIQAMRNFAEQCTAQGADYLVPIVRTIVHKGGARHGEDRTVERDECGYPRLYVQRIRGVVGAKMPQERRS